MAAGPAFEPRNLHFELVSTFESLQRIVEAAEEFVAGLTEDEDFIYRVVLLTSEAVTNAIEHGNALDPKKLTKVDFFADKDRIEVCVQDEGGGFDANSVADPLAEEHLLDGGGRGLFLMDQLADEVHRELDGCRLRLVFFRTS